MSFFYALYSLCCCPYSIQTEYRKTICSFNYGGEAHDNQSKLHVELIHAPKDQDDEIFDWTCRRIVIYFGSHVELKQWYSK